MVLIHGGSFRGGARNDASMVRIGRVAWPQRGVVVASIDYRLERSGPRSARRGWDLWHDRRVARGRLLPAR